MATVGIEPTTTRPSCLVCFQPAPRRQCRSFPAASYCWHFLIPVVKGFRRRPCKRVACYVPVPHLWYLSGSSVAGLSRRPAVPACCLRCLYSPFLWSSPAANPVFPGPVRASAHACLSTPSSVRTNKKRAEGIEPSIHPVPATCRPSTEGCLRIANLLDALDRHRGFSAATCHHHPLLFRLPQPVGISDRFKPLWRLPFIIIDLDYLDA